METARDDADDGHAAGDDADFASQMEAFYAALVSRDDVYKALREEKAAGWASVAVESQWKKRDALFDKTSDRRTMQGTPGTKKYVDFYRDWLPRLSPIFQDARSAARASERASREAAGVDEKRYAPDDVRYSRREFEEFFGAAGEREWHAAAGRRRFADVGAAPGGMSETLIKLYGWHGHAFSLSVREEGFGMRFDHQSLRYDDANLAEEGSWREMLRVAPPGTCDFVNLGIVVDRGQQKESTPQPSCSKPSASSSGAGDGEDASNVPPETVLTFLAILANEMRFGLQALARGGCLYFAYQTGSNLPMLYRILLVLRPAFQTMRLTPTFAAHRTPVYIFLGEYAGSDSEAGAAALAFFHETPTCLPPRGFYRASGVSEELRAWHVCEWSASVTALHEELLEDLHRVWSTQTAHLRTTRQKAEQEYAADQEKGGEPADLE